MEKKVIVLFVALLSATVNLFAQEMPQPDWDAINKDVITWRRDIHHHPELSFKEVRTSNMVDSLLRSFGNIEVLRPTPTSVLGILRGAKPGKSVGFRADMDALPIQEETGLPFASGAPSVSHACGHDTHTSMLLGTAKVLAARQKNLSGTVYFIF